MPGAGPGAGAADPETVSPLSLRAMIAATKPDGQIDDRQIQAVMARMGTAMRDPDARAFLEAEFRKPLDLCEIVAQVRDPQAAAQVYLASLLAIRATTSGCSRPERTAPRRSVASAAVDSRRALRPASGDDRPQPRALGVTSGRVPGAAWRPRLLAALQVGLLLALLAGLVVQGAAAMGYNWQWMRVPRYIAVWTDQGIVWGPLARGLVETVRISATAFVMALALGLAAALVARGPSLLGRWCARGYVELIRNTPLLVQLYVAYFVLSPFIGLGRWWTGVWCLALFEGAYAAEIYRAGLMAVPRGQWEAAASLGLGRFPTYARVILPQALRLMLPPFTNLAVALVKHSSIVSTIAVLELTTQGRNIVSDTFMSFEIWLTVAGIYLVVTITLSSLAALLERRLGRAAV